MKDYIGTKPLQAEPMTRGAYNAHRGWAPPEGEDQDVAGYHVVYADGYQSWSPARQFEEAYQTLDAMSFGHALVMLQAGHKVARAGWNGKGMWIALQTGSEVPLQHIKPGSPLALRLAEVTDDGSVPAGSATLTICPHIDMRAADGSIVVGWLASQTDMLANDWSVVG